MFPHWPSNIIFISRAIKHGTFQGPSNLEPSKGHQTWNLPLATKLGSSLTSFLPLLFKNTNLNHLSIFFLMWFLTWIFEYLFL
jgi:hypothetical protein